MVSYLMVYNPLLPLSTLVVKLSMIWPVGAPLKLAFVLFFYNIILFEYILSGITCSRFIFSNPALKSTIFPMNPGFFE